MSNQPVYLLGDIVISLETAKRQAQELNVPFYSEVLRLLVHGICHLCGYEHEGVPASKAQLMKKTEQSLYESALEEARSLITSER